MSAISKIEWTDRTGRQLGALKTAAKRLGLTLEEYVGKVSVGLKHCWRCLAWKHSDEFDVDRSRSDGRAAKCRTCSRVPPRQLNLLAMTQAEAERFRYATDPAYRHERRQRVHARKRGIKAMPFEGAQELTERFGGLCAYCDRPATTWDHVVPVSEGGQTEPGNIVPACVSCNSKKGTLNVYDFIDRYAIPVRDQLLNELDFAVAWGQLEPPDCPEDISA